ncbi:hypothetical protein AWV80_36110 [Cupriavidus sp. UYMU48A]|nr:hypothetical protein AWV80_36110 [Cupriavidus sp. UYMU48A]
MTNIFKLTPTQSARRGRASRVLALDGLNAGLLVAFADRTGRRCLKDRWRGAGQIARLPASNRPPAVSLRDWFAPLTIPAWPDGNTLRWSAMGARRLLSDPAADQVVLHGDMHHGNVLHFGENGWLAIVFEGAARGPSL